MKEDNENSFEIKIDINDAGDLRTLTVVAEGQVFSVLLNEINIAQLERLTTDEGNWHIRFSNLGNGDMKKIQDAIDLNFPDPKRAHSPNPPDT